METVTDSVTVQAKGWERAKVTAMVQATEKATVTVPVKGLGMVKVMVQAKGLETARDLVKVMAKERVRDLEMALGQVPERARVKDLAKVKATVQVKAKVLAPVSARRPRSHPPHHHNAVQRGRWVGQQAVRCRPPPDASAASPAAATSVGMAEETGWDEKGRCESWGGTSQMVSSIL